MTDVRDAAVIQGDLFDRVQNRPERKELMDAIASINNRYGPKTIKLSVEGGKKEPWMVKHEHRSQNYLTDINEILTIRL